MNNKPLIIVESPSKAKTISKYLDDKYEVLASIGHIKDLPKKDLGVDVENNFAIVEDILPDKESFFKELIDLANKTDQVVIATDPDREGEAIAAHIASEVDKDKISRVQFTEITKEGVAEGMNSPRPIDKDMVSARTARRVIDRLVGYKVSSVLWSCLKKNMKFVQVSLSAGRVQSAALRIIVQRERLRQSFHAANYYDLKATFSINGNSFSSTLIQLDGKRIATGKDFDPDSGKLKKSDVLLLSKAQADELVKELNQGDFVVSNIEEKIKNSNPKPPFTTSTLQQEAARKLRSSARKTMRTAQRLYENGFITYMRTDSTFLSDEGVKGSQNEIISRFGKEYLPDQPKVYKTKVKNAQEAHEAIRPAGINFASVDQVNNTIDEDAAKLYDLIRKRTLASQMKSAKIKQIAISIENQQSLFRANGKKIIFPGYMSAYVESTDKRNGVTEDQETILPDMTKGQSLNCDELVSDEHFTKPPARFTEASLVKELENSIDTIYSDLKLLINSFYNSDYKYNDKIIQRINLLKRSDEVGLLIFFKIMTIYFKDLFVLSKTNDIKYTVYKALSKHYDKITEHHNNADWALCIDIIENALNNIYRNASIPLSVNGFLLEIHEAIIRPETKVFNINEWLEIE